MSIGYVILLLFAGCGSAFIVTHGIIFKKIRGFISDKMYGVCGDFIHCPQCVSFYTGAIVSFLYDFCFSNVNSFLETLVFMLLFGLSCSFVSFVTEALLDLEGGCHGE